MKSKYLSGFGNTFSSEAVRGALPVGSMLELTQGGKAPIALPSAETRVFLEDGDEVILRARCERMRCVAIGLGAASDMIRG